MQSKPNKHPCQAFLKTGPRAVRPIVTHNRADLAYSRIVGSSAEPHPSATKNRRQERRRESAPKDQPFAFAFTFLKRIRPNSLAFLFTGPTWRPRAFAMSSALALLFAAAFRRLSSFCDQSFGGWAFIRGRPTGSRPRTVISPSPSALVSTRAARGLSDR